MASLALNPDVAGDHHTEALRSAWAPGLTRVPYWLYQDPAILRAEQTRIFEGPAWHYLCLEVDIPNHGDYRVSCIGAMPVIAVRGEAGEIHAFENRCAHRGALIAFQRGVGGKGGMPDSFRIDQHGPRKLRTATIGGLVFATLAADAPALLDYLGTEIAGRIRRVLHKPVEVIGRFIQPLPNNWKLYAENVKDTYHASLLHLFFTTFNITRFSQAGGVTVSECGAHHASTTIGRLETPDSVYKDEGLRSDSGFRLHDPSLLD